MELDDAIAVLKQGFVVESGEACAELVKLGELAFEPLMAAIAEVESDRDAARELSRTFTSLRRSVPLSRFAAALRHPSSKVKCDAAYTLQLEGDAAVPFADDLLPLLADPDGDVRQRAVWAFEGLGDGAAPVLQRVRRHGPGHLRKGALRALAGIAGEEGLDDRDRAAVERLIQVKLVREVPCAPHLCGSWLAVRTGDQDALMQALELSNPRPATMALGFSAVNNDHHHWGTGRSFETSRGRIFVTPQFGDWTLVFGGWSPVPEEFEANALVTCGKLSRQFGAAHAYGMSCGDGWMTWCIGEHGTIRRLYEVDRPEASRGARLPVEQGRLLPDEYDAYTNEFWADVNPDGVPSSPSPQTWLAMKKKHRIPDDVNVLDVAEAMSFNPATIGPHTKFSGHGLLTLNHVGRKHGVCPGALAI